MVQHQFGWLMIRFLRFEIGRSRSFLADILHLPACLSVTQQKPPKSATKPAFRGFVVLLRTRTVSG